MATYEELTQEQQTLQQQLLDPTLLADFKKRAALEKRHKELVTMLALHDQVRREEEWLQELKAEESSEYAEEIKKTETSLQSAKEKLAELERPRDPRDEKSAILEIRAGAGGDEASLFASELFGMYSRFAEAHGWKTEVYSSSASDAGGFKEIIFEVSGAGAYGALKFEAGTHRVQRVPATESQGRVHTSTVTVAVLPEVEENDVEIKNEEIRVDVFRSSGPGGQSVNTTDSAVRITHLPTGLVVSMQDEKSQHKNRAKAMQILRARLQALQDEQAAKERGDERRAQVGSGERSEKIRTYNFPQDRLTDHRIGYTTHGLDKIISGELDPVIEALQQATRDA